MGESVTGEPGMKEPYQLAMDGNWESLKKFYKKNPKEIVSQMTTNKDTALHVVASNCPDLLNDLISLIDNQAPEMLRGALTIENYDGNTPLHEAAASGNLRAAQLLVDKDKRLVEIRNKLGESPLYRAAAFGHTNLVEYFVSQVDEKHIELHFLRKDGMSILHIAVVAQKFETALRLLKRYPYLAGGTESNGLTSLQLLAQMPSAFEAEFPIWMMLLYKCFFDRDPPNQNDDLESGYNQPPNQNYDSERRSNQPPNQNDDVESGSNQPRRSSSSKKITRWGLIGEMFEDKQKQKTVSELTDLLVQKDYSWGCDLSSERKTFCLVKVKEDADIKKLEKDTDNCVCEDEGETSKSTYKYTPLLTATCTGVLQIVEKILKFHPQAIETRDYETLENILHVAIKHRRLAIFNIVRKKKTITSRLAYMIDEDGNSILHHAASMKFYTVDAQTVGGGPAFQLQEELRWMERVKKIMPPYYVMHQNNQGLTAQKLFQNEHTNLLDTAKIWITGTAQSCSTVAALVATVAYAAAFTAPGGNDDNGVPVLRHSPFFVAFTVSDTVSLICSLISLGTFLSILTSPFEYENFRHSLPFRLHLGFFLLFLSMAATMLTFTATVVLLIHQENTWTKSIIYVLALLPVPVFVLSQYHFYYGFSQGMKYISQGLKHTFHRNEEAD